MTSKSGTESVGVVGLGAMGRPIADHLVRTGFSVSVWNRSPEPVRLTVEAGARGASLVEIGRACGVVLTVLPDLPEVDEVLLGGLHKGMLEAVDAGGAPVLVIMGTVSPTRVREVGRRLARDGIRVVDAPVSGGDMGARRGELSIMAGGAADDVERVRAVLDPACGTFRHLGELGAGSLAKACNQIVVGATLTVLSEALVLGRAGGLDDGALLDVLAGGLAGSKALEVKREKWLSGDFAPGGRARFQLKDLQFAAEAGDALDLPMPVAREVLALYGRLVEAGHGDEDHAAIIRMLEPPAE